MPRVSDEELRSPAFKSRIKEADAYSSAHGLDKWGARILWLALTYSPKAALQYAAKNNRASTAWARVQRLIDLEVIHTDIDGIIWNEGTEPWHTDALAWFDTIVNAAAGAALPTTIPHGRPAGAT
jgi:hypothetical protein